MPVNRAGLNVNHSKVHAHFVVQGYVAEKTITILAMDVTEHLERLEDMFVLRNPVIF